MDDVPPLRISYDASADAAYVYLQSAAVVQPSVARTKVFDSEAARIGE